MAVSNIPSYFNSSLNLNMFNNSNNPFAQSSMGRTSFGSISRNEGLRQYMLGIYNYMTLALAITGVVALAVANIPALARLIFGTPLAYVAAFAPLAYVIYFSVKVHKMSANQARNGLFTFAILMGISLASIFLVYAKADIARAFFISAGVFGSMSIYGYTTKKDLTGIGAFAMMAVWGIILASIINMFMHSSAFQLGISVLAVLIFTVLTAYDTQKLKQLYYMESSMDANSFRKLSVLGALTLYMDFINIFISLLQIMRSSRD